MSRIWVVPKNDGEAVEIARLLRDRGERVLVTRQPWGATWVGLEETVRRELEGCQASGGGQEPSDLRALGARGRVGDPAAGCHPAPQVYGVELAGPNGYGAVDVDHHYYQGDDRRSKLSSLEQVAGLLGVELTRRQRLVAANDRGWIPAMLSEVDGVSEVEIESVRAQDREAQGLTAVDRARAERDLAAAEWRGERVLVRCPDGGTSWHSDLLFGKAAEWLLEGPENWSYSGARVAAFVGLAMPEPHWAGAGYFGVARPGAGSRVAVERCFWGVGLSVMVG